MARGAQVVIDLGGMAERGKRQGTDLVMPGLQLVLLKAAGQGGEVSGCTCQQQHWRGGLLDERDGVPEITARQAAESVHSSILRGRPVGVGEKIWPSAASAMHQFLPFAWFEGRCVPFEEAKVSVATHALHYGTGAFGGMRAIPDPSKPGGMLLFRAERHARRLSQSAKLLLADLSEATVMDALTAMLKANQPKTPIYLRPFVYTSDLGIAPRLHNIETDFLIYGLELGDYLSPEGVSCRISSWTRQEDRSLPLRGKISGAYITSSLAKTEAVSSGFDEALLMNSRGKVSEASGMNLFLVRNGQLITPGVDQDILEGITRASVIELAKAMGIEVIERPVDKTELFIADEVFLTGTAAKISPIRQLESTVLSDKRPVMEALRTKLVAITEGRDPDYAHWVTRIELND